MFVDHKGHASAKVSPGTCCTHWQTRIKLHETIKLHPSAVPVCHELICGAGCTYR